MDNSRVRAWWSHRQGLDGSLQGRAPAEVLERSGWARSVGGVGPYLTLYSRAGTLREDADKSVARLEIHELPSARGCTYVVPAADFALALHLANAFGDAEMKVAAKLGVSEKEIDKLCNAVIKALEKGPLTPDDIREATGNASRNLGEEGKKKGMITTLPVALGRLQTMGEIRRVPIKGRLDQQRFQYTLWRPNPLKNSKLTAQQAYVELAQRFFRWIGPATVSEFQWFSGLGVKDSKAAVEALGLVAVEPGSDRLMHRSDRDEFENFKVPGKPHYSLVSSLDAISALRRDVELLLDSGDASHPLLKDPSAKAGSRLNDLPDHAILDRGRLIGLWQYDMEKESIVWPTFAVKDKALTAAVETTAKYIREQLGDARAFSLDSPKSREPRIQVLRKAAGK